MLGLIRRTSVDMRDPRIRTALYKTLVRSHFVYSSQVWSPQSVALILDLEKVQRRATMFILSLSFQCYWHEYLDLVYFFKALKSNDPNIVVKSSGRVTRHNSTKSILTNVPRVNTLTFQNSYYNRAPRTYNCLPSYIRDADVTIGQFKSYLLKYYHEMTELIYDINVPQSLKLSVLNVTRVVLCRAL